MFGCLSLCLPGLANAQGTPPPSLTLNTPAEITLHKSASGPTTAFAFVAMGKDATGLVSILTSAGSNAVGAYFPTGTKAGGTGIGFYAANYPLGDYAFKATATNSAGLKTTMTVTIHLVN